MGKSPEKKQTTTKNGEKTHKGQKIIVIGIGYFCFPNYKILRDIIHLLPDNIANQIAAGEVIQRPGSAVKELLENAVDSGADEIKLIITDAGKSLVQVIDNGKGMSETDARMAFERHATSKISKIDDLFRIKTMGFRGEALASIAAVARVELKTRRAEDAGGTYIEIENSEVILQEPVAHNPGTSIAMKNLFFNVPARRNFLKSNTAELKNIMDEFTRVAMAFPQIFFSMYSNGHEVFHLEKGSLKQRLVQLLGNTYQTKLVAVHEDTDYLNISGFVGKPDAAKKTRGDQFLFVNDRFIKSSYLNHAISNAYSDLLPKDSFPMYALFIDLDPAQLDINVHPTKQEIKFEDEKIVYAFVQSAVKHALAQFSITPTLDFELDPGIEKLDAVRNPFTEEKQERTSASNLYQTFTKKGQAHFIEKSSNLTHWKDFYDADQIPAEQTISNPVFTPEQIPTYDFSELNLMQWSKTYILFQHQDQLTLVHQQLAHERVLYEGYIEAMTGKPISSQQSLFPATLELNPSDAALLEDLLPELLELGYQLEPFGKNTFVIQGTPADVLSGNEQRSIEQMLEQFKHFTSELKYDKKEKLMRAMAFQHAIKPGMLLSQKEMKHLMEKLYACKTPGSSPNGRPTQIRFSIEEMDKMFGK
ncbi:MAG: mismatch repair endonuclease MutL [Bacteroidota bacterium]